MRSQGDVDLRSQQDINLWGVGSTSRTRMMARYAAEVSAMAAVGLSSRIGTVEKGKEATLLIVDGNPLQDVRALSSISTVFMKGERVVRTELFEQK